MTVPFQGNFKACGPIIISPTHEDILYLFYLVLWELHPDHPRSRVNISGEQFTYFVLPGFTAGT